MGQNMLNELDFERQMRDMSDRELLEFTARQTFDIKKLAYSNEGRISKLEKRDNRRLGFISGLAALFGAAVAAVVNYFVTRQ